MPYRPLYATSLLNRLKPRMVNCSKRPPAGLVARTEGSVAMSSPKVRACWFFTSSLV
ncbi:hypothetical protein D3C80_1310590 [compost metagenome]